MSLPDRVLTLERQRRRDRERIKLQAELIEQMAEYLEVVMTFLHGHRLNGYKFVKQSLPLRAVLQSEIEADSNAE